MNSLMKWIRAILFLTLAALVSGTTRAGERGTTAADFLKIGLGAAPAGAGGAGAARAADIYSMFYNPAGLAGLETSVVTATHLNWIADTQYEAMAFALPMVGVGTMGAGVFMLRMPDIPALDENNNSLGSVRAYDLGLQVSYARDLGVLLEMPGLAGGANLKILHRELAEVQASGLAVDAGLNYALEAGLVFGLACSNLGYLSGFGSEAESLPLVFRAGAGYTRPLLEGHRISALADVVQPLDSGLRMNLGLEYQFRKTISLRAGYLIGYDAAGFQAGAGVQWENIAVDYALKQMGIFGLTHFITASVGIGSPMREQKTDEVKKILQKARELYGQGKYDEALKITDQALLVDSQNQQALELKEKLQTVIKLLELPGEGAQSAAGTPAKDLTPDEKEEHSLPAGEVKP